MNFFRRLSPGIFLALAGLTSTALRAVEVSTTMPDSLVLKNGAVVHGLIIRNSRDAVLIQESMQERSYPKSEVVRIRDEADTGMPDMASPRKGLLPPWRTIANDLRSNDNVKSLVEIPATLIDTGEFKNVPYMSFRVNRDVELDIYGDPNDPAGIELGIYGSRSGDKKLREVLRSYLAGFMATREEVAALYALPLTGGIRQAGPLTVEITPKDAPDAYGAWWISLYYRKQLSAVRLDDAEYAKLTRPMSEVVDRKGRVIANGWTSAQMGLSERLDEMGSSARVLLRGFFRDKNGDFRLVAEPSTAAAY